MYNVDLCGLEAFDDAWKIIFGHWLNGGGSELDIFFDEYFTDYMNANGLLNQQIRDWIVPYVRGYDVGLINMRRHAVIENGYTTGYVLLHGSNGTVGDFQMSGGFRAGRYGYSSDGRFYREYTIDLVCTWNDIIDPNYQYFGDIVWESIARMIPGTNPKDYTIRIMWNKSMVIWVRCDE